MAATIEDWHTFVGSNQTDAVLLIGIDGRRTSSAALEPTHRRVPFQTEKGRVLCRSACYPGKALLRSLSDMVNQAISVVVASPPQRNANPYVDTTRLEDQLVFISGAGVEREAGAGRAVHQIWRRKL